MHTANGGNKLGIQAPVAQGVIRLAAVISVVLVVCVTLYPFTGWHWPRYAIWPSMIEAAIAPQPADIIGNLFFYMPGGVLFALSLRTRYRPFVVPLLTLLSTITEVLQAGLPSRTPSLLDVLMNAAGAAIGVGLVVLLRRRCGVG